MIRNTWRRQTYRSPRKQANLRENIFRSRRFVCPVARVFPWKLLIAASGLVTASLLREPSHLESPSSSPAFAKTLCFIFPTPLRLEATTMEIAVLVLSFVQERWEKATAESWAEMRANADSARMFKAARRVPSVSLLESHMWINKNTQTTAKRKMLETRVYYIIISFYYSEKFVFSNTLVW